MSNVTNFPESPTVRARRIAYVESISARFAEGISAGVDPKVVASVLPTFSQFCAYLDGRSIEEVLNDTAG